jgi:hypothetical protein
MTFDPTEARRREMIETGEPIIDLLLDPGQKWTTDELTRDFTVIGFQAPFVVVTRKSDNQAGVLEFTGRPRVYFGFQPASE